MLCVTIGGGIAKVKTLIADHGITKESCAQQDPSFIHELKENFTIVIVTHNMQQAARVSDKTGFFSPDRRRPATTLSSMDMVGNGFAVWRGEQKEAEGSR